MQKEEIIKAIRVSIAYAAISLVWILSSHWLLLQIFREPGRAALATSVNDVIFVVVTAVLFFFKRELDMRRAALVRRETHYRSLFENMLEGFALCDLIYEGDVPRDFVYLEVNSAFARLTGLREVIGRRVSEVIPGIHDAHPELLAAFGRVASTGAPERFEIFLKPLAIWLAISVYSSTEHGRVVTVFDNITARKTSEERILQLSRVQAIRGSVNHAIVHIPDRRRLLDEVCRVAIEWGAFQLAWIGMVGPDGTVTPAASAGVTRYVDNIRIVVDGNDPDGRCPVATAIREDQKIVISKMNGDSRTAPWRERAARFGLNDAAVFPLRTGGRVVGSFQVYTHAAGVFDDAEVQLLGEVTDDISFALTSIDHAEERRKVEGQLQLEDAALESAANAVVIANRSGEIVWTNPAFTTMTGYAVDEVRGKTLRVLKSGEHDEAFYKKLWETILAGDVWHGEITNRHKNGSFFSDETTITPVKDAQGEITHFIAIMQDITQRKQLEQQIRRSQKLETTGRLAGGVAHTFNNLLQIILGYTDLALGQLEPDDPRRSDLMEVQAAGHSATALTRQLLAFGRKQNLDPRVTDLNVLVEDLNRMLSSVLGEDIRVTFDLAPNVNRVMVDPGQIGQILLNMAVNARAAMPNGGRLTFSTSNVTFTESDVLFHADARPGDFVCCAVTDTGTGMPPELAERIFEPFLTNKAAGKGTGLGLATAYGIARQHDGWIHVFSQVGLGTTFRIFLPAIMRVNSAATETARDLPKPPARPGHGARILFVEDEPMIRGLIPRQLERLGYRTVAAATAAEALAAMESGGERFDLVFSDILLPDLNGVELVDKLRAIQPDLRVVLASGYADNEQRWPVIRERRWPFLSKPYSAAQLAETIEAELGTSDPSAQAPAESPSAATTAGGSRTAPTSAGSLSSPTAPNSPDPARP